MTRSHLLSLAVCGVVVVGLTTTMLPALFTNSDAIGYLRATANGRHSTTTGSERPARVPEHRWRNEEAPHYPAGGQMQMVIPDNAGSDAQTQQVKDTP
ncbi:MAG: hypothetical protein H0W83_07955 [Planctomycetes bacterium]|nr:hypothetical protein [Planctomycetota bacterium]